MRGKVKVNWNDFEALLPKSNKLYNIFTYMGVNMKEALAEFQNRYRVSILDFEEWRIKFLREEKGLDDSEIEYNVYPKIDWNMVKFLFASKNSTYSVATHFNTNKFVLNDLCKKEFSCTLDTLRHQCMEKGDDNLRAKMYEMAMNGDTKLLIWLSRQYLGMRDNPDLTKVNLDDDKITINILPVSSDKQDDIEDAKIEENN